VTLPAEASVRAVPNFLAGLRAARLFMQEQDAASAQARFHRLQAEVSRARELLSFAPASGRPARFLAARSGWGRFQAEQALKLVAALGLAELREFVLERHVMLYAHSDTVVILLSIRHERSLGYGL
jgi:hypothetical protein